MRHVASPSFWRAYEQLPSHVQTTSHDAFELLKASPFHPSLHFKKVGAYRSVRIGIHYRALAVEKEEHLIWFWIGTHAQYDKLVK